MKTLLRKALGVAALCAVMVQLSPDLQAQHGLLREQYDNIGGGIPGLLNDPDFPNNPSSITVIPEFEAPSNVGNNYGQRVRGYIKPPQTGNYIFWIASDDQSQLFLSQDDQPADLTMIAEVFGAVGSGDYTAQPNQQSVPIRLEADKYYYIEAIMVEGGGSDHLSVRWQLPDGTIEEPIPGNRLYVELIAPQVTREPANVRVTEAQTATFTVQLANQGPVAVQWERNGVVLPGETNLTLTLPAVRLSDSGSRFRVRLQNEFGNAVSSEGILFVDRDVTPPTIISAQNPGENDIVTITFSEPVNPITALNRENYVLSGGVVLSATLDSSGRTVILRTTPLTFGSNYSITVNNVEDRADAPNPIEPESRVDFTFSFAALSPDLVYGKAESVGPSTRRTGLIVSEIMYHPAPRSDGRNLEFIELFNTEEMTKTIGGYRLTGAIEFTFPPGAFIGPRGPGGYLVVAANPVDLKARYGLATVYGPYTNSLPDNGTIQLLNDQGAVLLEINYDSTGNWPSAPDGAGPSLVLARASYGEDDPRAWSAGQLIGGTPGTGEAPDSNPHRGLVINEFLANTDDPLQPDFVELYNYSASPIDLSGFVITDDININKFKVPDGTSIQPLGFVAFTQAQLGFALGGNGERIIVRNPQLNRVVASVKFGPQANGVSIGRFPDGNPEMRALASPTAGQRNAKALIADVVINEIMYNPISNNQDEEYIELYNRSAQVVNLNGWRLQDGISHTFTSNFNLAPGGYLVIAKNLDLLKTNYPGAFTAANSVGNFNGNLSNGGERVVLERPDLQITTDNGRLVTNINYVVVNEVTFGTGGRWPGWADGGGSSMELIDPNSDNQTPSNWADSDESQKSSWTTVERRGMMDHGSTNFPPTNPSRNLHVLMMDGGESLMDNFAVIPDGGTNVVKNGNLENGNADWLMGGTHDESTVEPGAGQNGSSGLHVRTPERGDTASNRIRAKLGQGLTNGTIVTLRADGGIL